MLDEEVVPGVEDLRRFGITPTMTRARQLVDPAADPDSYDGLIVA
jgi:hypothetical protein